MLLANPLFYSTPTTRRNIPKALQEPETPLICVLLDPGANPYMNPQVGTNLKRSDFSYTFLTLRVHVDALAADPIVDASVTGVAVFAGGCGSSGVRVCGRCHSGARGGADVGGEGGCSKMYLVRVERQLLPPRSLRPRGPSNSSHSCQRLFRA